MVKKRTVLILVAHYLPGYKMGGPLTSIVNLVNTFSNEFDFSILTSDRDMGEAQPYPNLQGNTWLKISPNQIYYVIRNLFSVINIIKQVRNTPYDVLYLNSFFEPFFSISVILAAKCRIIKPQNIIIATRGELLEEALNFKKRKKLIYLKFAEKLKLYENVSWHASTKIESESIVNTLGVDSKKIHIALNLPNTSQNDFSSEHNDEENPTIDKQLKIVFLSRISKDKNVVYTLDVLNKVKANVKFDIYGPIEDDYLWDICKEKIEQMPTNIEVSYHGSANRNDVKKILSHYDIFFLPTFAENYGHAIAESLSVGTPVLISDRTPWRQLNNENLGWDIALENIDTFVATIEDYALLSTEERASKKESIRKTMEKRLLDPSIKEANRKLFNL